MTVREFLALADKVRELSTVYQDDYLDGPISVVTVRGDVKDVKDWTPIHRFTGGPALYLTRKDRK